MKVQHRLQMKAICPVDQRPDCYEMLVRAQRLVKVEDILTAVAKVTTEATYQEDLTQALSRELAAEVETRGWHSGVETVVICGSVE